MLKKLLKGIAWLLVVLVAAGFLFVWQGLGVNPLEGDAENIWDLVSNQVDFFARFPGTDLLGERVVEGLGEEEGFDFLSQAKDALADAAEKVAREVNPKIPLGLFKVDLEKDLKGKEVAVAGLIRGDFGAPRLDNFVVLVRIPGYAKFVSALRRDFVRTKIPNSDRITVVAGNYFRIKDPALVRALAPFRSARGRDDPDSLWFARIRDVFLLTDEPMWIEDALRGGANTLPADVDFKTEFIPVSGRRGDVELLLRPGLAQSFVHHLGRLDRDPAVYWASRLVPTPVVGNLIAQATPEADGFALRLANHPLPDGYSKIGKPYLEKLYERPKADLRFDYTENGIGRLIPRKGVAGALIFHADAETLVSFLMDSISDADRSNLDSLATQGGPGGKAYPKYEALLQEIAKDLADTTMVIVHRPSVFETLDLTGPDEPEDGGITPQASFSLVCAVRDTAEPQKVVDKISQNLRYLGLRQVEDPQGKPMPLLHKSGKFCVADLAVATGNEKLVVNPAYGAISEGGRYFIFTSSVENMEAILAAAGDPAARLIAEPGVAECVGKLPQEGTLSVLARGGALRGLVYDRVRASFRDFVFGLEEGWAKDIAARGIKDEAEAGRVFDEEKARYMASEYPTFRDSYRRRAARLGAVDTAMVGLSFGLGPTKMTSGAGYLLVRKPSGAGE